MEVVGGNGTQQKWVALNVAALEGENLEEGSGSNGTMDGVSNGERN